MIEKVRSSDGTEIAFDRSGDGPPLVLVVGAFSDRSSMKAVEAGLRDAFTVYAYDRRGRGESGDAPPYAVDREVEDLAAVIEVAGEPAFVFGQSSGGALALEAAAGSVPIRALVVNEPPFTEGPTTEFAEDLEGLVAERQASEATAAFLGLMGTPPAAIEDMKAGPAWAQMEAFAPTLSYEVRLCNNGLVPSERLAGVGAPTLALAGEASPPWAHDVAQAIAAAVPRGQARVLSGQSHRIDDAVLISVLKEFCV
ncbi:MAG TPA: alpha/beta hydrolase [Solirubrobacteraceae bacterium]